MVFKKGANQEGRYGGGLFLLGLFVVILFAYFAVAAMNAVISSGENQFNINDQVQTIINITINNSDTGATGNISQVNITLPPGVFFENSTNVTSITSDVGLFTYRNFTRGNVLTWYNNTGGILVNGTHGFDRFYFNVTANASTASGSFNITIMLLNNSGATTFNSNISIKVNDSVAPTLINFTGRTNRTIGNASENSLFHYFIYEVNVTSDGPVDRITVTLLNASNSTLYSNQSSSNVTTFFGNFSGLRNGFYYVNASANDTGNKVNFTSTIMEVGHGHRRMAFNISDQVTPLVSYGVGTIASGSNITNRSSIYVNLSVTEINEANITFVLFNESTSFGFNKTTLATAQRTNNWTILTSYPDGNYTFNVTVEDYAPSFNQTLSRRVTIDNTIPVVSQTCSPANVYVGDTVTCTCSISDATSGVQTSSFTSSPSTSNTGTYTTSCTATDHAGKSNIDTDSYTVELGSSGGSGGGGGGSSSSNSGSWKVTHLISDEQLKEGFSSKIKKDERFKVSVEKEDHYVGIKSLSENSVIIEVSSNPQTVTLGVGETKKFEVNDDNYYDLSVSINSISGGVVDMTVKSAYELIPGQEETPAQEKSADKSEGSEDVFSSPVIGKISKIILVIVAVLIVVAIVGVVYWMRRKGKI